MDVYPISYVPKLNIRNFMESKVSTILKNMKFALPGKNKRHESLGSPVLLN
jgi:hypothetical protein